LRLAMFPKFKPKPSVMTSKTSLPHLLVPEHAHFILRPFALDDAPRLAKLAGVTSVVRYTLGIPLPYSVEAASAWIAGLDERVESGIEVIYALSLRQKLVGSIGLTLELEHRRAEIGYWVGEPYRGKGLASAAVAVLSHFGFEELRLTRIYGLCFPENIASQTVLRRAGFKREGRLRAHIVKDARAEDVICFGRTARVRSL
jgi:[ribosomal protein S5]-alanine N-acetyltransferase